MAFTRAHYVVQTTTQRESVTVSGQSPPAASGQVLLSAHTAPMVVMTPARRTASSVRA